MMLGNLLPHRLTFFVLLALDFLVVAIPASA